MIPNLKLVQCLQKMHLEKPIYADGSEKLTVWAPMAGGMIRMLASHYRDLVKDEKMSVCIRKAFLSLGCE